MAAIDLRRSEHPSTYDFLLLLSSFLATLEIHVCKHFSVKNVKMC